MEEVKLKDKNGKFQKLKPEAIPDFSSLLNVVRKKYPDVDQKCNLTYVPENRKVYYLKNEEDFQVMKTFKNIKIFYDSNDLPSIKTNSNSEISSSITQEHEKIEQSKGQTLQSEDEVKNLSGDNSEFKKEEEKPEERMDQFSKRQEISELNEEQKKQVDDSKGKSTKEHQRQKQQKIESQGLSIFFICKVCQAKYPDGVHYRCLQCFDYDVCEDCFNKNIYKETDHKAFNHEFISIQSREEWESIDFRPVIRLFLDPYSKDRGFLQMHKITHSDMTSKGKQGHPTYFEKEMKEWKKEYERRINNNIENWIGEFQQLRKQKVQS